MLAVAGAATAAAAADGSSDAAASQAGETAPPAAEPSPAAPSQAGLLAAVPPRPQLEAAGISVEAQQQGEVWANLRGGRRQGTSFNGLTTAKLDIDLGKAVGWSGARVSLQAFDIHGHGPSSHLVGALQLVSNIEAAPSIKLFDLWLEQTLLEERLSLRLGQEGADEELMTTAYGGLFLNSSLGFPAMPAVGLPSGGPAYPLATPFVRTRLKASDNLTIVGAVYNGDPAPPGTGDPQLRDRTGTAFRLDDHALAFGEVAYSPHPEAAPELPTTYKIGLWYASSHFADRRFDSAGLLLADPASAAPPRQHSGDWAVYGVIDQLVWQRPGSKDQGIGVFLRVVGGPADRNLANLSTIGGINWRAPFEQRPDDAAGLSVAYLGISPAVRAFSRDLVFFGRAASPYAGNETVIEATYQAAVTSWMTLQPDLQLVLNAGAGSTASPGHAPLSNAVVIGMRAAIKL